jgi:hypothetical protein
MNPAVISALAAVGGSSVGAMTPVLTAYIVQRGQIQRYVHSVVFVLQLFFYDRAKLRISAWVSIERRFDSRSLEPELRLEPELLCH